MGALNGMKVGAYAGEGTQAAYQFQLVICADGRVDDVRTKKPSGDAKLDGAITQRARVAQAAQGPAGHRQAARGRLQEDPVHLHVVGLGAKGQGQVSRADL